MATAATAPFNRRRRRGLALVEGLTAASAIAGAVGLASGSVDLGAATTGRLPFESPVFGGAALAVVVALPMGAAAVLSWRCARRADLVTVGAGVLLLGWILVELVFIRSFSWLHPTFFLVGAAIALAGHRRWPPQRRATDDQVGTPLPEDVHRHVGTPS